MSNTLDRLLGRIPAVRVAREAREGATRAAQELAGAVERLTAAEQATARLDRPAREPLTREQADAALAEFRAALDGAAEVVEQFRVAVAELREQFASVTPDDVLAAAEGRNEP